MIIRGRRLKRYFGLRRKRSNSFGGVDVLKPSFLSGWIISKDYEFKEIRLYKNKKVICKTFIDIYREDIYEKYKLNEISGFKLYFNSDLKSSGNIKDKYELYAFTEDDKYKLKLEFVIKNRNLENELNQIFQSEYFCCHGHVDGFGPDGFLTGWIGSNNKQNSNLKAWLHGYGLDPIEIKKKIIRPDLNSSFDIAFGFSLDPYSLPLSWANKEIYISLDKLGLYKFSQESILSIPDYISNTNNSLQYLEDSKLNDFAYKIKNSSGDIKSYWQSLESFSLYLDNIETILDEDYLSKQQNNKELFYIFKNIINKFFSKRIKDSK